MLYGVGLTDADMQKAQVGISSVWFEGNTCNMHLNQLSAKVKEGVDAAGLVGLRFNTIGVSDGISMGTEGMKYSLVSREVIADSIETVTAAQGFDGLVAIGGNGTLTGLTLLSDPDEAGDWPVQCVGIPASIDNDIALTGLAIGVDTAMNTIAHTGYQGSQAKAIRPDSTAMSELFPDPEGPSSATVSPRASCSRDHAR